MDPLTIGLEAWKASAMALSEYFKFLQTPAGQAFSKQLSEDRTKWDAFWDKSGDNIVKFFEGLKKKT